MNAVKLKLTITAVPAWTASGRSATAQYDAPQGSFEEAVELIVGQLHIVLVFSGQSATAKDDTPQ